MSYLKNKYVIGFIALVVIAYVLGSAMQAKAQDLTGVMAIQGIPERTHEHVSFEVNGYRVEGGDDYAFTAGAGWTLWKLSVGAGLAVQDGDCDDMMYPMAECDKRKKAIAVGSVFEVSDFVQVKVGYSQDPSALNKLGTVAVGLAWGF